MLVKQPPGNCHQKFPGKCVFVLTTNISVLTLRVFHQFLEMWKGYLLLQYLKISSVVEVGSHRAHMFFSYLDNFQISLPVSEILVLLFSQGIHVRF